MIVSGAFLILATLATLSALLTVTSKNAVISALWLAGALTTTAGIYVLLNAELLAVLQLIIYAGAILVFFLFVVMLLNVGQLAPAEESHPNQLYLALFTTPAFGLVTLFVVFASQPGLAEDGPVTAAGFGNTRAVAARLFSHYLAPFEFTSVLLLVAMVGAVVLASRRT